MIIFSYGDSKDESVGSGTDCLNYSVYDRSTSYDQTELSSDLVSANSEQTFCTTEIINENATLKSNRDVEKINVIPKIVRTNSNDEEEDVTDANETNSDAEEFVSCNESDTEEIVCNQEFFDGDDCVVFGVFLIMIIIVIILIYSYTTIQGIPFY